MLILWYLSLSIPITEDELAQDLEHSDSNEDDSQEISLEIEEKLLKDEPECKTLEKVISVLHFVGMWCHL